MSEADKHLADLEDLGVKIEEFREEVSHLACMAGSKVKKN